MKRVLTPEQLETWLIARAGEVVGERRNGPYCPLATYLLESLGDRYVVTDSVLIPPLGREDLDAISLPRWAQRFVQAVDGEDQGHRGQRVSSEEALVALHRATSKPSRDLRRLHWMPINDRRVHVRNAACWCEPNQRVERDLVCLVHLSADGREAMESVPDQWEWRFGDA